MAGLAGAVAQTIGRTVEGLGYEFVEAERMGGGLLRVTIDRAGGIRVDDCERVSRQLTHVLAVDDVDYARLEVSSPGLDRPLRRVQDFERFVGAEIEVRLHAPLPQAGGRKRLQGRLLEVAGGDEGPLLRVELTPEEQAAGGKPGRKTARRAATAVPVVVEFALADVDKAKLVPELNFRGGSKE
jgi:ribosome maturation factor RimP